MARVPGSYNNSFYTFKSPALDRYIYLRASSMESASNYAIRCMEIAEKPLMVTRSLQVAERMLRLLPDYLNARLISLKESQQSLLAVVKRRSPYHDEAVARRLAPLEQERVRLESLLHSQVLIMLIETRLEVVESRV